MVTPLWLEGVEEGYLIISTMKNAVFSYLVFFVVTFLLCQNSIAASFYTFTNIIDTNGLLLFAGEPSLNDLGVVAFGGSVSGVGVGIFSTDGNSINTIVAGSGFNADAQINNSNNVVFGQGSNAIFVGDGLTTTLIADNAGVFSNVGTISLNDSNLVGFHGEFATGRQLLLIGDGSSNTIVADTNGVFSQLGSFNSLNTSGQLAFRGNLDTGDQGIFVGDGTSLLTIADNLGVFSGFDSRISMNDSGSVVFRAGLDAGGIGIFVGDGTTITPIAYNGGAGGTFNGLNDPPMINNLGTVAFQARLPSGINGIFTGPDPIADKVISIGDPLFGSTVTGAASSRGLNNLNQIAFEYSLANGTRGIAIASPIPEPSTILLLGTGLAGLGLWRYRKHAKFQK